MSYIPYTKLFINIPVILSLYGNTMECKKC